MCSTRAAPSSARGESVSCGGPTSAGGTMLVAALPSADAATKLAAHSARHMRPLPRRRSGARAPGGARVVVLPEAETRAARCYRGVAAWQRHVGWFRQRARRPEASCMAHLPRGELPQAPACSNATALQPVRAAAVQPQRHARRIVPVRSRQAAGCAREAPPRSSRAHASIWHGGHARCDATATLRMRRFHPPTRAAAAQLRMAALCSPDQPLIRSAGEGAWAAGAPRQRPLATRPSTRAPDAGEYGAG